jgi:hypothetical protein
MKMTAFIRVSSVTACYDCGLVDHLQATRTHDGGKPINDASSSKDNSQPSYPQPVKIFNPKQRMVQTFSIFISLAIINQK